MKRPTILCTLILFIFGCTPGLLPIPLTIKTSQVTKTYEVLNYPQESKTTPTSVLEPLSASLDADIPSHEEITIPTAPPQTPTLPPQPLPGEQTQAAQVIAQQSINPLTGLAVADASKLERRPIAIKISNYPRNVRPQCGLSLADIVYEYYLEQNVTRFMAIFYGNDAEKVGPVRSGRFFDEHIFRMYQAFYVFGSADDRVMDYFLTLEKSIVNHFVMEQPEDKKQTCQEGISVPLCRDRSIHSWNNLFVNTAALMERIEEKGIDNTRPNLSGMVFAEQVMPAGKPAGSHTTFAAGSIDLDYSVFMYALWVYDENQGRYLRFDDAQDNLRSAGKVYAPLLDRLTNQVVAADNVVVLFVPHEHFLQSNSTEILQIQLTGSGQAYLFRNGTFYPGKWVRPEGEGVLYLVTNEGDPLPFKPGVTFFEVMGVSTLVWMENGNWHFDFRMP